MRALTIGVFVFFAVGFVVYNIAGRGTLDVVNGPVPVWKHPTIAGTKMGEVPPPDSDYEDQANEVIGFLSNGQVRFRDADVYKDCWMYKVDVDGKSGWVVCDSDRFDVIK